MTSKMCRGSYFAYAPHTDCFREATREQLSFPKGLQSIVGSSFMGAEGSCGHSLIRHRGGVRRGGLGGSSFLSLLLSGFSLLAGLHCRIGLTFSGSNRLVLEASTGRLWGCRSQALWSLR